MLAKKSLGAAPAAEALYVEDVFSTYLYTGNSSSRSITNGVDLAGEGGLVWLKERGATGDNGFFDTVRGTTDVIYSNLTNAESSLANSLTAFNADGFSLGTDSTYNFSNSTYASWTFRKAEKFFDVVTYTGTGSARTVSHNLGSTPGFIIVKRTDDVGSWACYHTSIGNQRYLKLESNAAQSNTGAGWWNNTSPTSTEFTVGTDPYVNSSGATYVAYLFAHDAGGFGDDGDQSVISCGSFTSTGSAFNVNLGYEPQWIMIKASSTTSNWRIFDTMRGWITSNGGTYSSNELRANTADAETAMTNPLFPTATGFTVDSLGSGNTYIYIAIRRGPMKTPESGTSVFALETIGYTNGGTPPSYASPNFPVDLLIQGRTDSDNTGIYARLTGTNRLFTNLTDAQSTDADSKFDYQKGVFANTSVSASRIGYMFRRAPGFFDAVCYTGTGVAQTINHSLGVAPELILFKGRNTTSNWMSASNFEATKWRRNFFTSSDLSLENYGSAGIDSKPTATTFRVAANNTGESGTNFVAYLFASVTGVSKVGTYTGNGSNQTINCGFTAGARFVMIKRIDTTGNWIVFDSFRGIVSGNDPYITFNTTDAPVTTTDTLDPDNSGFIVNQNSTSNLNVNSATYLYLAIA